MQGRPQPAAGRQGLQPGRVPSKGGYRVNAINLINQAIVEVQLGIDLTR